MKRLDFVFVALVACLATFVGVQARGARVHATSGAGAISSSALTADLDSTPRPISGGSSSTSASPTVTLTPPPPRDVGDIQRRLLESGPGTYIGEILAVRDSALARWPDRRMQPLRVWVQPFADVANFQGTFAPLVRGAFDEWASTGIPLAFTFVRDSAAADVHVTWIDHFDEPISGKTLWAHDDDWWIVEANIVLAVHHHGGDPLDANAVRAIALHEVGHLVGLDHTADTTNIMTGKVRVKDLSAADRLTARLLYSLPAGSVKTHGKR